MKPYNLQQQASLLTLLSSPLSLKILQFLSLKDGKVSNNEIAETLSLESSLTRQYCYKFGEFNLLRKSRCDAGICYELVDKPSIINLLNKLPNLISNIPNR